MRQLPTGGMNETNAGSVVPRIGRSPKKARAGFIFTPWPGRLRMSIWSGARAWGLAASCRFDGKYLNGQIMTVLGGKCNASAHNSFWSVSSRNRPSMACNVFLPFRRHFPQFLLKFAAFPIPLWSASSGPNGTPQRHPPAQPPPPCPPKSRWRKPRQRIQTRERPQRRSPRPGMLAMPNTRVIPALHGFTEGGVVTLCQVIEQRGSGTTHFGLGQANKARSFRALSCLDGMHINGIDEKCLTSAKITFEGLSGWFPQAFDEESAQDQVIVRIPREPCEVQDLCLLDSRVRIAIKVVSELTSVKDDQNRLK